MVVAPAFHSLRALITTVSEVERQRASIAVYSMPGTGGHAQSRSEARTQVVTHNQGTVRDSRVGQRAPRGGKRPRLSPHRSSSTCRAIGLLGSELARIRSYTAKGDLAPAAQVLRCLMRRDAVADGDIRQI